MFGVTSGVTIEEMRTANENLFKKSTASTEDIVLALKEGRTRVEGGWIQHKTVVVTYYGQHYYCASGALMGELDISQVDGHRAARLWLQMTCLDVHDTLLVNYNDTRGRTKQDILDLYDIAIERLQCGKVSGEPG